MMINIQELKDIFAEKLIKSKSVDEAFTKACWVAYKQGLVDNEVKVIYTDGQTDTFIPRPNYRFGKSVNDLVVATDFSGGGSER